MMVVEADLTEHGIERVESIEGVKLIPQSAVAKRRSHDQVRHW